MASVCKDCSSCSSCSSSCRKLLDKKSLSWSHKVLMVFLLCVALVGVFLLLEDEEVVANVWKETIHLLPKEKREQKGQNLVQAQQQQPPQVFKLRFDWTDVSGPTPSRLYASDLAQKYHEHQRDCSLRMLNFQNNDRVGLGSAIHRWTAAMCNAVQNKVRLRTRAPWIFLDESVCLKQQQQQQQQQQGTTNNLVVQQHPILSNNQKTIFASSMKCYFPQSELLCPNDTSPQLLMNPKTKRPTNLFHIGSKDLDSCVATEHAWNLTRLQLRAAGVEFLFRHVSQEVVQEAERQLQRIFFGLNQLPSPEELITVHIRWGDKKLEMELLPIEQYVKAVQTILSERRQQQSQQQQQQPQPVHIFLATEAPDAAKLFLQAAQKHNWTVYLDDYLRTYQSLRQNNTYGLRNMNSILSRALKGHPGLVAMGSLLVAMQSNSFVLTLRSNWSRLMNELRLTILEPSCGGGCTRLIDLNNLTNQGYW